MHVPIVTISNVFNYYIQSDENNICTLIFYFNKIIERNKLNKRFMLPLLLLYSFMDSADSVTESLPGDGSGLGSGTAGSCLI